MSHLLRLDDSTKETTPLPEDVELKELQCLKPIHDKLVWKWRNIISLSLEQEVCQIY